MSKFDNGVHEEPEFRNKLVYGVNQADECWDFVQGPSRELIAKRLREIDTRMVRLFVFDKQAPDPVYAWPEYAKYPQAVLDIGAVPMITFGKFRGPFDDPIAIRRFAERCSDVVWNCVEQWGGENVRNWFWCVLNEPNNGWISGGLTFEQYRHLYEAIAVKAIRWLEPYLGGRKPLIGGPAVEGFPAFWWDWPWRFIDEVDHSLIGFLDWHRYADWRNTGQEGAPSVDAAYKRQMMSVALDYQARARAVGKLVEGKDVLNVCGELNLHSHYETAVREHFNYTVFAGTFYVATLLHLMRGGADVEMYWTGTEEGGGYGMINKHGAPRPAYHAKKLCAQYVRHGDWISFPKSERPQSGVDVVTARGDNGRLSALFVHLKGEPATYYVSEFDTRLGDCPYLIKIDEGTGNQLVESQCEGIVTFQGYGVAVVTNSLTQTDERGQITNS